MKWIWLSREHLKKEMESLINAAEDECFQVQLYQSINEMILEKQKMLQTGLKRI